MKNIICKIFGHKIVDLNTKRRHARCSRCSKDLKVTYDISYGDILVIGDYGNQKTFCYCDCGNELCSTNSLLTTENLMNNTDIEYYKCSKCFELSTWDFGAPAPIRLYTKDYYCECKCEIAKRINGRDYCADCEKPCKKK